MSKLLRKKTLRFQMSQFRWDNSEALSVRILKSHEVIEGDPEAFSPSRIIEIPFL